MGYNRHDTMGGSVHAELAAIETFIAVYRRKGYNDMQIRSKLRKHTLVIIRVNNDRTAAKSNPCRYSMPCTDCISALKAYGIKQIAITTDDGDICTFRCSQLGDGVISSGRRKRN